MLCFLYLCLLTLCQVSSSRHYIPEDEISDNIIVYPTIIKPPRQKRDAKQEHDITRVQIEDWILILKQNQQLYVDDLQESWISDGIKIKEDRENVSCQFYSGRVWFRSESRAIVTICNDQYYGFLETYSGSYFVEPTVKPVGGHIMYNAKLFMTKDNDVSKDKRRRKRCSQCEVVNGFNLTGDVLLDGLNFNFDEEEVKTTTEETKVMESKKIIPVRSRKYVDDDIGYFVDTPWVTRPYSDFEAMNSGSKEKWLEMALAVDYTVINFHGKDKLKLYIMALMNIVSVIYKDASLNANLNLVLSKLIFYDSKSDSLIKVGNAKKSLEAVNRWNHRLIGTLPKSEKPHDIAVWLTREYIGGPSGYAPVAGVCDKSRSTALNKDEGLASAFIIAHEMAHILGLTHDGDLKAGNQCDHEIHKGTIMAPTVTATFNRFAWSSCSKKEFQRLIKQWTCLSNPPKMKNLLDSGVSYTFSMDEQCRMEYGDGYHLCNSFELIEPCTHLWCGHKNSSLYCITKKGPPVEGTQCGFDKWCIEGYCQSMDGRLSGRNSVPQDGDWGPWTSWGDCTTSCDYGVQKRYRHCDNPSPTAGGADCKGDKEEVKICINAKRCEISPKKDVRGELCLGFNEDDNEYGEWLPYHEETEENMCKVSCILWSNREVMKSGELYPDGTPCSYDNEHHICIKGKCHKLGCNGVENSTKAADACGECGGTGRSCVNSFLVFKKVLRGDMTKLMVLPKESRHVSIVVGLHPNLETNDISVESTFHLALKKKDKKVYGLEAKKSLDAAQMLKKKTEEENPAEETVAVLGGAAFKPGRSAGTLTLRSAGPLLEDIAVLISSPKKYINIVEVTIQLNYTLPSTMVSSDSLERYVWTMTKCHCDKQPKGPFCIDALNANTTVDPIKCSTNTRIKFLDENCDKKCDFHWVVGEWEFCSATCGDQGVAHRELYCIPTTVDYSDMGDKPWIYMVEPTKCGDEKPLQEKPCNRILCPAYWIEEPWSECSTTCGAGISMRSFKCSAGNKNTKYCGTLPPPQWRACHGSCPRSCVKDKSIYCALPALLRYCVLPDFEKLCCMTCKKTE